MHRSLECSKPQCEGSKVSLRAGPAQAGRRRWPGACLGAPRASGRRHCKSGRRSQTPARLGRIETAGKFSVQVIRRQMRTSPPTWWQRGLCVKSGVTRYRLRAVGDIRHSRQTWTSRPRQALRLHGFQVRGHHPKGRHRGTPRLEWIGRP